MPSISAIVPTIGRPDSLVRLLESLCAQTCRVDEVVVADGSDDRRTSEVVRDVRWANAGLNVRLIVVHPPHAVRQRSAAIAAATGECLLLLDDDVALEPDCVEQLLAGLMRPGVVAASADFNNQTWPSPTRAWHFYLRHVLGMAEGTWQGRVVGPLLRFGFSPVPSVATPIEWMGTGNTLLRRSAFDAAGGFSDFFLHRSTINEDVDLGLKIRRVGTIMFCPAARLAHYHAPGGRVTADVAAEDDLFNRFLILRRTRHKGFISALGLIFLYLCVETCSNIVGGAKRGSWTGLVDRTRGRLRATVRAMGLAFARFRWPRILATHPRPFRLAAAKLLVWTGTSRFLTLRFDGYRLRFYPSNATINLWVSPQSRMHGLELFRDYCKPGDVVVDVGANVGEVSIVMSQRVGPAGSVFAFEPLPRVYGYLRGNLALNACANVKARNVALGAAPGVAHMTDDRRDDMNRLAADGIITIDCSTLDIEVPADLHPALVKIDVEGTELNVLSGGSELLSRTSCVNCEMWQSHFQRNGYSMGDLIAFLRSSGFSTFVIDSTSVLRPIDDSFAEDGGHELIAVRDVGAFIARTGWSLRRVATAPR